VVLISLQMSPRRSKSPSNRRPTRQAIDRTKTGAARFSPREGLPTGISRPALFDRCLARPGGSILVLEGPAGCGKSTLFRQWFEHLRSLQQLAIWAAPRKGARSWRGIADTLVSAASHAGVSFGRSGIAANDAGLSSIQDFVERFLDAVCSRGRPVTLLLDDYQNAASPEVDGVLEALFEQMPRNLVVAIASRNRLQFGLSRWLLQERVERLDKNALFFSKEETRLAFGESLSPSELQRLFTVTEGWPAAVKLARLCLEPWREEPRDLGSLSAFTRLLVEFSNAELLRDIDEESVAMLLDASAFEIIEADLCDAVRDSNDSSMLLSRLASRETFIEADSAPNTWRMPAVLRLALLQRSRERSTSRISTIHRHAAQRFESNGNTIEAIRHYVDAGEPETAARALERVGPMAVAANEGDARANEVLNLIPPRFVALFPRLALCRAYMDYKEGLRDEAHYALEDLAARTEDFTVDRDGAIEGLLKAESLAAFLLLDYYRVSSCSSEFLRSAEERVAQIIRSLPRMAAFSHALIGQFYKLRGDLDGANFHFMECEKCISREAAPWWIDLWVKYHRGALALARGRLMEGRYRIHTSLKAWRKHFPTYRAFGATASLVLAEIDYEADLLDDAQRRVDDAITIVENVEGWHEQYATVYEVAVMIMVYKRSWDAATALLVRASEHRRVGGILKDLLDILRLRVEIQRGRAEDHSVSAELSELHDRWMEPQSHDEFSWRAWDLAGLTVARAAVQTRDLPRAEEVLNLLEGQARRYSRDRMLVKVLALQSACRQQVGHWAGTANRITEALEIGCTQGYRRALLDEGEVIQPILALVVQNALPGVPARLCEYAARLIDSLYAGVARSAASPSLLSTRETEVLHELNLGHSNKVIGRNLSLQEPTVKFHVKNICRKLEVRKRDAAVAEARRLGLLT
jgi:LuxR family transcriptional regulator, maltose regulon positive regulatory protein